MIDAVDAVVDGMKKERKKLKEKKVIENEIKN